MLNLEVIFVRDCVTIFAVKRNKRYVFGACVFSFMCPACKAHAPYYILFSELSGSTIFSHVNGTIFGKKVFERKICFDFIYKFYLKYFLFEK
jgi:hypothetical protein